MIVLDPNNTTHNLQIIPRYYNVTNTHTLVLFDEDKRTSSTETIDSRTLAGGTITYTFDKTVTEAQRFSYKITDTTTTNIVNRGKIFVTAQTPQTYSYA